MFTNENKEIFTIQFTEFIAWAKVVNEYSPAKLRILLHSIPSNDHRREIFEQCNNFLDVSRERLVEMFGNNEEALQYFQTKKFEWIANIPHIPVKVQHNAPLYPKFFPASTSATHAIATSSKPDNLSSSLEDLFNLAD